MELAVVAPKDVTFMNDLCEDLELAADEAYPLSIAEGTCLLDVEP
jgi:hypothetical protein